MTKPDECKAMPAQIVYGVEIRRRRYGCLEHTEVQRRRISGITTKDKSVALYPFWFESGRHDTSRTHKPVINIEVVR